VRLSFCVACGDTDSEHLQHHHLVPRANGGTDDETNLITLCVGCHGKAHGHVGWSNDRRALTRHGLAAAKARGVRLGNPDWRTLAKWQWQATGGPQTLLRRTSGRSFAKSKPAASIVFKG